MRALILSSLLGLALLLPTAAFSHASSQAYLQLQPATQGDLPAGVSLRADIALRDLDAALDLDANGDGQLTWGEVRLAQSAIESYVLAGLQLQGCAAGFSATGFALEERADGVYAALSLSAPCAMPSGQPLRYQLMAAIDPTHRALLRWTPAPQAAVQLLLLNPAKLPAWPEQANTTPKETPMKAIAPAALLTLTSTLSPAVAEASSEASASFWWEGMVHLVTGYDHLLFLLCLLLPAVLRRGNTGQAWQAQGRLQDALLPVLGIVTAFTLAHSITLALAALGHVRVSPAVIEPLIALSIVLTAIDNLWPLLRGTPRWRLAFGFGLIHGFGFAGVLAELELPANQLAWALLQFNVGLELAQVAVVAVAMSLLWSLRQWSGYPRWVLGLGSSFAALMGAFWVVQRVA